MNENTKKSKLALRTLLVLLMIFMAALNVINRYYYFAFIAFILFASKSSRKYIVDGAVVSLLTLAISWAAFSPDSTVSVFGLLKPFLYLLFYVMGSALISGDTISKPQKTPLKLFYIVLVIIAAGTFLHYVLNWLININSSERNTIDFWTGDIMAATGQASLACIPLGVAVACIFSKNNKWIKIISCAVVLITMLYNLILAGRTLILMLILTAVAAFLYNLKMRKLVAIKIFVIALAVIILLLFVYQTNLFGVKDFVERSIIYERFFGGKETIDVDEDQRMDRKIYHFENMHRFLFGGANIREEVGYSHDIIFDTHDEAGIFALIAILSYLITSVYRLIRCISNRNLPFVFRQIVLCTYVICYLEFMIEPILQGMPWFFACFCLIDGYVGRILSYEKSLIGKVV